MAATIPLTDVNGAGTIAVNENLILYIGNDTLGSCVEFVRESNGQRDKIITSMSPANVAAMCTNMFAITYLGVTGYVNATRIDQASIDFDSTGAFFRYDQAGSSDRLIQTSNTVAAFYLAYMAALGKTVYSFDDVNATNDTFSLTAANGNKTSEFTSGVWISVVGNSTQATNGGYKVSSSAFSGGKTVISVDTAVKAVPANSSETGTLFIIA